MSSFVYVYLMFSCVLCLLLNVTQGTAVCLLMNEQ